MNSVATKIDNVIPFPAVTEPHVIVTGGSGYVGGHICKALYQEGYIPIKIDRNIKKALNQWKLRINVVIYLLSPLFTETLFSGNAKLKIQLPESL